MAAMGSLTARTQIGQHCAARHQIRVAGFQAGTQQAASDRSQCSSSSSYSVSESVPAAMARQGFHRAYWYPAWGRDKSLSSAEYSRGLGIQSRGMWGSFLKGLQSGRSSANASNNNNNNFDEDVRVDTRARARDPESAWQDRSEKDGVHNDRALSVVEVQDGVKPENNAEVAQKAVVQGSNVATSALEQVGDVLKGTGLEVQLDLGLKELTIEKLVLRDLGLVLEIKTKPQPQPLPEPEPPVDV